jgi:phage tail-like protein
MGSELPGLYQDDSFSQRLTDALDEVLAPIIATLDNMEAYLDPAITPADFVDWLGGWVGIVIDETWDLDRRRTAVARAVDLYRMRGTVRGLEEQVGLLVGGSVKVTDNGKVGWSPVAGTPLPGRPEPSLTVRVTVDDPAIVDRATVDALVSAAKPAHLPHKLEIVKA